jgi:hypothetical protein
LFASGANTYVVYRNGIIVSNGSNNNVFVDTGLTQSTAYNYQVSSVGAIGEGAKSASLIATTLGSTPAQVQGLTATPISSTQINLGWVATPGASSYNIFRNSSLISSGGGATSYNDTGLLPNTSYNYNVSATNSFGTGPQSTPVSAMTVTTNTKWNPGHYLQSGVFTIAGNPTGYNQNRQNTEIPAMRGAPAACLGLECVYFWTNFENNTLGSYNFSVLDSDYVACTGYQSGTVGAGAGPVYNNPRRYAFYFLHSDYFHQDPTVYGIIPNYILQNPATYGPGPTSGVTNKGGGYWTTTGSAGDHSGQGSVIAYWRTSVINRLIALFTAMANHVLPDGYTCDTSPYFEWIRLYLESTDGPENPTSNDSPPGNGLTGNAADPTWINPSGSTLGANQQLVNLGSAVTTAWPHTNIIQAQNYAGNTGYEDVALLAQYAAIRNGFGGPDTFGFTSGQNVPNGGGLAGLTFAQAAYIGLIPPTSGNPFLENWRTGGTDLRGVVPFFASIQDTELIQQFGALYTPVDILNQINFLKGSHAAWTFSQFPASDGYAQTANFWGNATSQAAWNAGGDTVGGVLTMMVNNPITTTAIPSSY